MQPLPPKSVDASVPTLSSRLRPPSGKPDIRKEPGRLVCPLTRLFALLLLRVVRDVRVHKPLALLVFQVPEITGQGHVIRLRSERSEAGYVRILLRRRHAHQG